MQQSAIVPGEALQCYYADVEGRIDRFTLIGTVLLAVAVCFIRL